MIAKLNQLIATALLCIGLALPASFALAQQPPKAEATETQQPSKDEMYQQIYGMSMQQSGMAISADQPGAMATGACSLCWTCGGSWPHYGGTIPTRTGATERGSSCSGSLSSSSDTIPYLCCRGW